MKSRKNQALPAAMFVGITGLSSAWAGGNSRGPALAALEAAASGRTDQVMDGGRDGMGIAAAVGSLRVAAAPGATITGKASAGTGLSAVGADSPDYIEGEDLYTGVGASAGAGVGIATLVLALALKASPGVVLSITWVGIPALMLIGAGIGHWLAQRARGKKQG